MADLNDLGLPEVDPDAVDAAAETYEPQSAPGGFTPTPQPGTYVFSLPKNIRGSFEPIAIPGVGPRIRAVLKKQHALRIVGTGDVLDWNCSGAEFPRGKDKKKVSTLENVLAAVGEKVLVPAGVSALRTTDENAFFEAMRRPFAEALIRAGEREAQFRANLKLTAQCNPAADIYKDKAKQPGIKGCGRKYTTDPYPLKQAYGPNKEYTELFRIPADAKDPAKVATRFECKCGAVLTAWPDLDRIRRA